MSVKADGRRCRIVFLCQRMFTLLCCYPTLAEPKVNRNTLPVQADRDGQAADFAAAYEASDMCGQVQQELKAAGATTAEPSADLDSVLLVRRGTTVPAWHAWLTLHKVRASRR